MTPQPDDHRAEAASSPAEARLEASRARLRQALAPRAARETAEAPSGESGELGPLEVLEHVVAPAASEIVRRYPARSLASAALAGALLVRLRPWSGLIGSVVSAALVRQISSASIQWAARQLDTPPR